MSAEHKFDFKKEETPDGRILVKLFGELNGYTHSRFQELAGEIRAGKGDIVIIDFTGVSHFVSQSFAVLVELQRSLVSEGRNLYIKGLSGNLARIFEVLGGTEIFEILPDGRS